MRRWRRRMSENTELPNGWVNVRISDVGDLLRGVSYKKEDATNKKSDNYIPILRANNINGELKFDELVYVPKKYVVEEQLIKQGDIVFAMSSGSKHLVGKSAKAKIDYNGSYGAFCALYRPTDDINKSFIAYFFQGSSYKKLLYQIAKGTKINNLKGEHLLDLDFPLPEQHAIVFRIEQLFSELDKGIESLKTAQQQLKVYRQSVLKSAFEGKLTNENVKEGELPEGWKWAKVKDIGKIETGTTPSKSNPEFYANDFPFFKPTDLEAGINVRVANDNLSNEGIKQARYLKSNSILVTCIGATIGKTGLIKVNGACNQQINSITPHESFVPEFVYYQVISHWFQEQIKMNAVATTLPILNKSKFEKLDFIYCPKDEQYQIVQEIESRLSECDNMEATIAASLQQAEACGKAS